MKKGKCNLYSLGEGSHFKLEMRDKRKGIFGNTAQSHIFPLQKILSFQKMPFSHQIGKSEQKTYKKTEQKEPKQGILGEV